MTKEQQEEELRSIICQFELLNSLREREKDVGGIYESLSLTRPMPFNSQILVSGALDELKNKGYTDSRLTHSTQSSQGIMLVLHRLTADGLKRLAKVEPLG